MPSIPKGTGQLNLVGVPKDLIKEFNDLCFEIEDGVRRKKPKWKVFKEIYDEWKSLKEAQEPQTDDLKVNKIVYQDLSKKKHKQRRQ